MQNIPQPRGGVNVLATPQAYATGELIRLFYLAPMTAYFLMWTYNELALALSMWVGIRVDSNFNRLPLATSVREFWLRWHITVGRWAFKYIYFPIGGNRGLVPLHYLAVFLAVAVWHGAGWSGLIWGMSQGVAMSVVWWFYNFRRKRGWEDRPSGPAWAATCWFVTMHYQLATIVIGLDPHYFGMRILPELFSRLTGIGG